MAESVPNATSSSSMPTADKYTNNTSSSSSSSKPVPSLPQSWSFPPNLPQPPFINISGLPNFRDIGGYLTATSYLSTSGPSTTTPLMTRKNLIYRCAHPQLLTPEGNRQLTETHHIKHIFDLRSAPEVKKLSASLPATSNTDATSNPHSKALEPTGITRHFVPVYENEDSSPNAIATKVGWYTAENGTSSKLPYSFSEGFVAAYRDISTYAAYSEANSCPSHVDRRNAAYPRILRQILERPEEPIVFHCTAGKDRTGVLTAMLLRVAGVDDDTIAWEYALTEPGLGSWRELFIERIARGGMGGASLDKEKENEKEGGSDDGKESAESNGDTGADAHEHPSTTSSEIRQVKPSMTRAEAARIVGSRANNMRAFLTLVMDGEYGGVDRYLVDRCGLTEDEVQRLREILVVPVTEENAREVVMPGKVKITGWTPEGGCE